MRNTFWTLTAAAALLVATSATGLAQKSSPFPERRSEAEPIEETQAVPRNDYRTRSNWDGHVNVGVIFGGGRDRNRGPRYPDGYPDQYPDRGCNGCGDYGWENDEWRREEAKRRAEQQREADKRYFEQQREADKRYFEQQREAEQRFYEQEREAFKRQAEFEREMAKAERERRRDRRP